ncbi:hypothetical protein KAR91_46070, partial [Candidatus Pacearchaeota archaeon]|nr:hypothetical protein [Candidatus Pacearchaeota archaeon]
SQWTHSYFLGGYLAGTHNEKNQVFDGINKISVSAFAVAGLLQQPELFTLCAVIVIFHTLHYRCYQSKYFNSLAMSLQSC